MIKIIMLSLLFLQPLFCLAQSSKSKPPPPPAFATAKKGSTESKYPYRARRNFYPFNQASQIKLVFFERWQKTTTISSNGRPEQKMVSFEYRLPIRNDTICFSQIAQTIALPVNAIDSLTDLLYNTCYRSKMAMSSKAGCYLPHNAILFFDKNDQPFEYIELCFDCRGIKYSSSKVEAFDDCDDAFYALQNYFTSMGIAVTGKEMEQRSAK
jgi:hypothetical protein